MVQELIARWRKAKNEILRRQSDIKDCFERLSRFKKGIEQHVTFIERKEQEFHSINQTTAETSESLERKIEAMQDVQKDLNDHRTNFSSVIFSDRLIFIFIDNWQHKLFILLYLDVIRIVKVETQGDDLNVHIDQANANMSAWASECEKSLALPTLERYVEVEISVVTQKYDKFGRLIAETIEKLKIKLRET